jgi:hypothetical protein
MDGREEALTRIRGSAPSKNPTVRVLAAATSHHDCPTAMLGFASNTDFDNLCAGTTYEAPFGQDPQAFRRGEMFERRVKSPNYGEFLRLLREHAGFPVESARIADLRGRAPRNAAGLRMRETETRQLLRRIARNESDAPNLIDGAVLRVAIGNRTAYFEADGIAAADRGSIHVAEIKAFPYTDNQCDNEKLGAAMDQAAWYALLVKRTLQELGFSGREVSETGFIILPQGIGLMPTLLKQGLAQRISRAERVLATACTAGEPVHELPRVSFPGADDADRIETLENILDTVGSTYRPECLANCGLSRLCRQRAQDLGLPSICGGQIQQQLPEIRSLQRAAELAHGTPPASVERHAASALAMAARLYERVIRSGQL